VSASPPVPATAPHHLDLGPAAAEIARLVAGVRDDQLDDPTPTAWPVATLLHHLFGLSLAFTVAARKGRDPAADGPAPRGGSLPADWRIRLPDRLDRLVTAWRDPDAWQGEATVAGVTMPAPTVARVVLDELVLHGWDLARATDQDFTVDPADLQVVLAFTAATAEPGQEAMRAGLFGPVVAVPEDAPPLDRALGFAGRDPAWAPDLVRPRHRSAR
jgi:uncharacterized protein (TIGR03086 family)